MKFIFSTDGHLSASKPIARKEETDIDYIDTQIQKRKQMYEYAIGNHIDLMIDGGDFFNAWNPKDLPTLLNKLLPLMTQYAYSVSINVNIGNHDVKYHNLEFINDSALGILQNMALLDIPDLLALGDVQFDFFHYSTKLESRESMSKRNIAVIHENIFEKSVPPYMSGFTAEELVKELPGYDLYLCGHNHQQFVAKVGNATIINGGSIMRLNTKQINYNPAFWEIDVTNDNIEVRKIPFAIKPDMIGTDHLKKNKIEAFVQSTEQFEQVDSFDFQKDVEREIEIQKPKKAVEKKVLNSLQD